MSVPNPGTTKWVPLWNTGSVGASSGLLTGDLVWSVLASRGGAVACDGALYNSVVDNTFAALYAAIGTTYGGTGPASFAVPDVRGRLLVCKGVHADVDVEGDSDGLAVASRTPVHNSTNALTWSGSFAGIAQNTSQESVVHTHGMEVDTGYVSADHTHGIYSFHFVSGGSGQGITVVSPQGDRWVDPSGIIGMHGIGTNHTHHVSGGTGGQSVNHVHAATAAGTVSGTVGGAVGPGGTRPVDRPSYIVENCFIVK